MSTARRITPGARARRALLARLGGGAAVLALIALQLTAGLGVVAFFGLPVLLVGLSGSGSNGWWGESGFGAGGAGLADRTAPPQPRPQPRPERFGATGSCSARACRSK